MKRRFEVAAAIGELDPSADRDALGSEDEPGAVVARAGGREVAEDDVPGAVPLGADVVAAAPEAEVAKLFNDAGLIVLAAFVAPEEAVRQKVAATIGAERFLVVHLCAPLEVCRQRDPDGHYKLADQGEIAMPGLTTPYEPPASPDLVLETDKLPLDQCVERLLQLLEARGVLS